MSDKSSHSSSSKKAAKTIKQKRAEKKAGTGSTGDPVAHIKR